MVILRESDLDVLLVALLHADKLILETGDETAAAESEIVSLRAAAVELLSVHGTDKIDVDDVALFRRGVGVDDARLLVACVLDLFVHLLCGDFFDFTFDGKPFVLAEFHLGTDRGFEHESHAAVVLEIKGFQFGLSHNLDVVLFVECLGICFGNYDVHRVLEKYLFAVHSLYDLAGNVTFAETGHGIFVLGLAVGGGNGFFERFRVDVKGELDLALFQLFNCVTHLSSVYAALSRNN